MQTLRLPRPLRGRFGGVGVMEVWCLEQSQELRPCGERVRITDPNLRDGFPDFRDAVPETRPAAPEARNGGAEVRWAAPVGGWAVPMARDGGPGLRRSVPDESG